MATIRDRYVLEVDTEGATRGVNRAGGAIGGLAASIGRLGPVAAAAGAALAAIGAVNYVGNTIDEFDELAKSARLAGAAASEDAFRGFQVLQQAMAEAGIDAATFDRAMLQTTSRLQEGLEGGEAFAEIVGKLGDSIVDSEGQLVDGATALQEMINALNEGTISTDEFAKVVGGRAGPLIQAQFASLNTDAETLAATLADVEANSNIVSLEAAENAEGFNDTMGRLGEVASQLGTELTTALLPVLVDLAEGALTVLPGIIDGVKNAFATLSPIIEAFQPVVAALFELFQALQPVLQLLFDILGPIAEVIGGALTAAIQGVITVIETVIGSISRFVDGLQAVSDKVGQISGAVGQKWNSMTDGIASGAEDAYNATTGWFSEMYDEIVGNSIIPDMADDILRVFDFLNRGMNDSVREGATGVARGFDGIAENIAGGFNSFAREALNGIESLVDQVTGGLYSQIQSVAREVNGSFGGLFDTVGSIFGGGGGGSIFGGIENIFNDLFGGFFADGGRLPRGKFGVVGEAGPELVTGPAQITPLDGLGGTYVTYNINAVDSRSFTNLLARDPSLIHSLAERGRRKQPGRY